MGKPAARVGDMHSGHGCFPPTNAVVGSPNVKINGRQAMMVGGMYQTHCCPKKGCHPPIQSSGSGTVRINGRPASRLGDMTGCGAATISGSSNVLIGG
jgi:uncharacterized Zn-binding protein involved in type VI secretion